MGPSSGKFFKYTVDLKPSESFKLYDAIVCQTQQQTSAKPAGTIVLENFHQKFNKWDRGENLNFFWNYPKI